MSSSTMPTSPASLLHSNSPRKPSSPSDTLSTRSFGFASDRSPLQKLELELKHISKEESDDPSLGRSLSKRQEERLQRSTTITSRLTSGPTSPSSSKGRAGIEDNADHHHNGSGSSHRRHKMTHLLGKHHHPKDRLMEKEKGKDGHYDTSDTKGVDKIQTTPNIPAVRQAPISASDRVGRKAHHHRHGYQFQHIRLRSGSSSSSSGSNSSNGSRGNTGRISQTAGGEEVFKSKVAHLTLEDGEFDFAHGGDAAEDDDGRRGNSSQESTAKAERETWRGSVMIVTTDDLSDYSPQPIIRLFAQPVPELDVRDINGDVSGELTAMTATDKPKSVRSAEEVSEKIGIPSDRHLSKNPQDAQKLKDGEKMGKYKEVEATKLHAEQGVTFWRFEIEVELSDQQARIAYRINHGPSIPFWVPARGETMNIMFHSCNGFSSSVNPDDLCGPDPLWKDVLREHQKKPFHVMLGGGDQIYNDAVSKQTTLFKEWLSIKTPFLKSNHPFTMEMSEELENFYLERYCMWFSQGLFGVANAQIPMINIWDDHDIIDGFAFKYYLLFQHQSIVDEEEDHEPSWLLGAAPGPYIPELSRSCFMFLGRKVAFLGLDCRTERMKDLVLCKKSYDRVFDRLQKEVVRGETKHLIVLLGIPIAYPRLVWLEYLMTSRLMDPFKALGRMGYLGGFINNFDGGVELLDDLNDHWTANNHKSERNWFVKRLQAFAAEKSVRITILGGDVHLAGIGQFYSNPKLNILRENDHRYMPNIISSAIVNTPPPNAMADVLNKRNKIHHLDHDTDEDMYPIFETDVDGRPRNNKRLLPRRNYAVVREHIESEILLLDEIKPIKRSTFSKIRKSTFRRSRKLDSTTNVAASGFDGANTSASQISHPQVRKEALDVILRMEMDQKNPSGNTKPYRLIVPVLNCEKIAAGDDGNSDDHGNWI